MEVQTETDTRDLKTRCHGKWPGLLVACGVPEEVLTRKNKACPMCGGVKRFTFDDHRGDGDYFCRHCGAGDGLRLLCALQNISFAEAKERVRRLVGGPLPAFQPAAARGEPGRLRAVARRIWEEGRAVQEGDDVWRYLQGRGIALTQIPVTLRRHPSLGYFVREDGKSRCVAEYPAMLALVQGPQGEFVTVHRTYLKAGQKARGAESKKLLSGGLVGGAIRLWDPTEELGIAEGIETALAVHARCGQPVWSAINCRNLEQVVIPVGVRVVAIYGDNDADSHFDGQASAFSLARRLVNEADRAGIERRVRVYIPVGSGNDWCDVLTSRAALARAA